MPTIDRKKKLQVIPIVIAAPGNEVEIAAAVDKLYNKVTGIACSALGSAVGADEAVLQNSVFNRFEIDSDEVFPSGFEAKFIGIHRLKGVPPDELFYSNKDKIGQIIPFNGNNSTVNIKYKDGAFIAPGASYPYTLNVYLRLEQVSDEKENPLEKFKHFLAQSFEKWSKENASSK